MPRPQRVAYGSSVTQPPSEVTALLAVYGTLRRGYRNHPLIARGSVYVGAGMLPGRLAHITSPSRRYPYPGYLPDPPGPAEHVVVEVVRIVDDALWPCLDALERYLPADPGSSEYLRTSVTVQMAAGVRLTCWTYVYNRPTDGWGHVPDGDWAALYPPDGADR